MSSRTSIFISHGNPEDNEFAGWLAARLAGAGYRVWIDLWHDKGHPTWDEIQKEIRDGSKRLVALVSKSGAKKDGFKDEINAASGVARDLKEEGFIIPVRLDDISFITEVPIQLGRLNFIDGNGLGWDNILAQVLAQLDKDDVERTPSISSALYQNWLARRKALTESVSTNPERVFSNWYAVRSFPQYVYFYSSDSLQSDWAMAADALKFPKRFDAGVLCTFAPIQDVRMNLPLGVRVKLVQKIPTQNFCDGSDDAPVFSNHSDALRVMVDLVRQGFGKLATTRGCSRHELSNKSCWFTKLSVLKDERVKFDVNGFSGSRKLVGRHKESFWHFATSIDVAWTPPVRITVSGHVIFSIDGETLIDNTRLAAKLRRQAVRSKRNAWWRDVMLSYMAFLAEGRSAINLPMGGECTIEISPFPLEFLSPFKLEFDAESSGIDGPIDETLLNGEEDDDDVIFDTEPIGDSEDEE